MKKRLQLVFLLGLAALATGCASTGGYLGDRCRDTADVFSLTVGTGAGAKARVGPLFAGLLYNRERAGLRGGTIGLLPDRCLDIALPVPDACSGEVLFGGERYLPEGVPNERGKGLWSGSHFPFLLNEFEPTGWHPHWTQIDLSLGLVGTVKVGVNPGELLDFILGWTTIDIYDDDIE